MKLAEYQASTAPKFQTTVTAIKSLKWFEWKDSISTRQLEFPSIQTHPSAPPQMIIIINEQLWHS
jgi:hypothetical protein